MEGLIERAAKDLIRSKHAIALTGAGISTESGIPDFRGPDGIWTKNPEAEMEAYRSYDKFKVDPKVFWEDRLSPKNPVWKDAGERFRAAKPNPGHLALAELEKLGILKCVITQNVDGLHLKAGNTRGLAYHGDIEMLRCTKCLARFPRELYDLEKMKEEGTLPPRCPDCGGVVKEDTVSFGEPIPRDVYEQSEEEAWKCDVMLVCGTSAVVTPFAFLPRIAKRRTGSGLPFGSRAMERPSPAIVIEVNAEPTPLTHEGVSDYLLQGKTGEVLPAIEAAVKRIKK